MPDAFEEHGDATRTRADSKIGERDRMALCSMTPVCHEVETLTTRVAELTEDVKNADREIEKREKRHRKRVAELEATAGRTEKANNVLQLALADLDASYSSETCPRVQCQSVARRLNARIAELETNVRHLTTTPDDGWSGRDLVLVEWGAKRARVASEIRVTELEAELADAQLGWARDLRDLIAAHSLLQRITTMPLTPCADGLHSHDRATLMRMVQDELQARRE